MKPHVLLATRMPKPVEAALDTAYTTHRLNEAADKAALLAAIAAETQAVATMGKADAALMDALPNLKVISSFGVGYDGVDVVHASKKGIAVTNTPDVLNDDVANLAVMLVLAATRNFCANERYLRAGRWPSEGDPPLAHSIRGRTVGIIGLGRIGKTLAEKLQLPGLPHRLSRPPRAAGPGLSLLCRPRGIGQRLRHSHRHVPGRGGNPRHRQCQGAGSARP